MRHETKGRVPLKTVSTQEALALACAALRINSGYIKDTRRFSEPDNKTQFANKEIVKFAYASIDNPVPDDYVRRYVMLGLGDLDDFKKDMIGAVAQDTVPVNNLGRVAFIPEFVKRDKHETGLTKTIRIEYRDSKHIEPVGKVVEGVLEFLDKRYSTQWESYNYTAVINGNLVSFMNKHDHEVGSMKRIKGKVKAHTKNKLFGADETRLNYVKLYKV